MDLAVDGAVDDVFATEFEAVRIAGGLDLNSGAGGRVGMTPAVRLPSELVRAFITGSIDDAQ